MYHVLVAIVMILPCPSLSLVDCRTACERCRGRYEQYPGILEVYCSMCRECNSRRLNQKIVEVDTPPEPEACPTPPPCEESTQPNTKLVLTVTATTSTQTPCPPVTGCISRGTFPTTTPTTTTTITDTTNKKRCQYPCGAFCPYPCVPICPYPCGAVCPYPSPQCPYPQSTLPQSTSEVPHLVQSMPSAPTSRHSGDLYVYIGLPRDIALKPPKKLSSK